MKNIFITGLCLIVLFLAAACDNPFFVITDNAKSADGEVTIRVLNANGRTIMPINPLFSRFDLTLQKEGENPLIVTDTDGIEGAGVTVKLAEGKWTITLTGYQEINGKDIPAAQGTYELTISTGQISYIAEIELKPFAISGSVCGGLFSFDIILPEGVDSAILNLKDSGGNSVDGYDAYNLLDNNSGSIELASGYYDLSIILTKNSQFAGLFEAVHIYSGLVSPANINMSGIIFTGKVYLAGALGGIRIGTIKISSDEAGINIIKMIELERDTARRGDSWLIDIPADYIGKTVYAVLEFNGEKETAIIPVLEVKGHADVDLNLLPESAKYVNLAPWYSTVAANGGNNPHYAADGKLNTYWNPETSSTEIVIDYGFNVTVNFSRLMFYSVSGSIGLKSYNVDYWDGNSWMNLVQRGQSFTGSADGSVSYSSFFDEVTAQRFRWKAADGSVPAIIEFSLYNAADRSTLIDTIEAAQINCDSPEVAANSSEVSISLHWVTKKTKDDYQNAIDNAIAACDNPYLTDDEISEAKDALDAATGNFNNSKTRGSVFEVPEKDFNVQDGYADKFVVTWKTASNFKYKLYMSDTNSPGHVIYSTNADALDSAVADVISDTNTGMITVIVSASPGVTKYFSIVPIWAENDSPADAIVSGPCMTLGVPVLTLAPGYSYSTITSVWTSAQKADAYRINYKYSGETEWTIAAAAPVNTFDRDGNNFTCTFKPRGYNEIAHSGKELHVKVDALNEVLRAATHSTHDIFNSSREEVKRLVGPAELDISASIAASADYIDVLWNEVHGASGYYVSRRQFNMNNTSAKGDAVMYYVDASSAAVTGKKLGAGGVDAPVTATASLNGSRFTLRDAHMTDAAYSSSYNGYAQTYRDQQNDMAQGYPYRYIVIPVINSSDIPELNFVNNTYAIQEKGETVTLSNAVSLEKTGFAIGFAVNVTASKGTYASSGNTNDGIQITWETPPMLSDAGLTYIVYRKAYNGSTWEALGPTGRDLAGNLSYIDKPAAGIMHEYTVGIQYHADEHDIRGPSLPYTSSRFMAIERAKTDGNGRVNLQGYVQDMVTINRPSRDERKAGNDFAIEVTWNSAGIAYGGSDANWGIDGYDIYVMNRNVDAVWHRIADKNNQSNSVEVTNVQSGDTLQGGLLKVLRDYRQYFKVRSYVMNGATKIYSPDPDWNFETLFAQTANRNNQDRADFLETAHVKWGARQITHTELVRAASIVLAWGIDPSSWQSTIGGSTEKTNGNNGSSGEVYRESSSGVGWWWYDFRNYKPDMDTNANKNSWIYSVTFLTVHTNSNMSGSAAERSRTIVVETAGAGGRPRFYGALENYRSSIFTSTRYNYGTEYFNVNGPSCMNGLYNAQMRFYNDSTSSESDSARSRRFQPGSANPGDGFIEVKFPVNASSTVKVRGGVENTALMFSGQNSNNSRRSLWY